MDLGTQSAPAENGFSRTVRFLLAVPISADFHATAPNPTSPHGHGINLGTL